MTDEATEHALPELPDEKLWEIARGIHHGSIFTSLHLKMPTTDAEREEWAHLIRMIWTPIALGGISRAVAEDLGIIWSHLSEAGPRSVNGYPVFMSANFVGKAQTKIIFDRLSKFIAAEQAVQEGEA